MVQHQRKIYGFLDVLGDVGGVQAIIESFLIFLIAPFAEHAFLTNAMSKLFVAKSSDKSLFQPKKSYSKKQKKIDSFISKLPDHQQAFYSDFSRIRLKTSQIIKHFIKTWTICGFCFRSKSKVDKLYSMSEERIEKEMDIVCLIKNIRTFKLTLKDKL